jgi:hypothetical protein
MAAVQLTDQERELINRIILEAEHKAQSCFGAVLSQCISGENPCRFLKDCIKHTEGG